MWNRTALIFLVGFIFGVTGAAYYAGKKGRWPSSVEARKQPWVPAPIGKHLAALKVEIRPPDNIPEDVADQEVILVGRIFLSQNPQSDLNYAWTLPEGVNALEGQLNGSIQNVHAGQIVEVKLTVGGFNKEKQRLVSLQASITKGSEILGGSAVVASRPEDTLESVAAEMKRSADEQLGLPKRSRR